MLVALIYYRNRIRPTCGDLDWLAMLFIRRYYFFLWDVLAVPTSLIYKVWSLPKDQETGQAYIVARNLNFESRYKYTSWNIFRCCVLTEHGENGSTKIRSWKWQTQAFGKWNRQFTINAAVLHSTLPNVNSWYSVMDWRHNMQFNVSAPFLKQWLTEHSRMIRWEVLRVVIKL